MEHIYDVIVAGGGPAGYTAALYASRAGLDTIVIEKLSPGGQMTLTGDIDNYPGFPEGIDGYTLGDKMQQGAHRFGATTVYAQITGVDFQPQIKRLATTDGEYCARTVIIATGAEPRQLGIEGEADMIGNGIHYCAHCDGMFYRGKEVAVVGGGNSAAADAMYLSRLAKKVYVIHRRDKLRATKIYQEPMFLADNIEFVWNSTVERIDAKPDGKEITLTNVVDGHTQCLLADGVFVSIGRNPSTAFLDDAVTLDDMGYIIADESTKTNIPGVYAAGDVRTKILRQVVTAVADGAVAAHCAEEYISHMS